MAVSKTRQRVWEFGPFRLEEAERLLLREGRPVGLTPKVFDTLLVLLERSGHLVEKDELMARLWPDTFVEEGALTRNISDLRKVLGEEKYVETVPKRGYRFVASVKEIGDERDLLPQSVSTAEAKPTPLAPPARQTLSLKALLVLLASTALIAGGTLGWRKFSKAKTTAGETHRRFQEMQLSRFTASGNVLTAAISPDGKYVATVLDEGGLQSLWVRQVAANTSGVRLLAPAQVEYWGLTFSNDGNFIYYLTWVRNQSDAQLYQLPVLGGTPRNIPVGSIDTPISFSPAGDRFVYVTSSSLKGEYYVKVAGVEGAVQQTLAKRHKPEFFPAYPGGPAWSPDGSLIVYAASAPVEGGAQRVRLFATDAKGKEERPMATQSWLTVGRIAWLGDNSGLALSAREQMDAPRQLWFVSYPDGAARKITNDLHDYDNVTLSGDAKTLAAVQTQAVFSIAVAPYGKGSKGAPISLEHSPTNDVLSEISSGRERVAWTPDHRLVYCSRASGDWDLWLMNKDGSERKQLTFGAHNDLLPTVSADGRYVFFVSDRAGAFNLWRLEFNDNSQLEPTQLTRAGNQTRPEVTPDGQWVVYQEGFDDEPSIWKIPAKGGAPEPLSDRVAAGRQAQRPAISPDGKWLAYVAMDDRGWGITVCAFDSGKASQRFPFPPTVRSRFFGWTPDRQGLAYIANEKGAVNLWLQPLNGAQPSQLTNFKTDQLSSFIWSPDGHWLAYLRTEATSDVVLFKDFN